MPRPKDPMRQRMHGHDYTRVGFYMITMATAGRRPLFGECSGDLCHLNQAGHVARRRWSEIPDHRPQVEASTLVVMPDHLHGIIHVREELAKPLGNILRGYASGVTSELRKLLNDRTLNVWEEGFHDRVIRNNEMLAAERRYIRDNPRRLSIRKANPDLFVRVNQFSHARLPNNECWAGYGNLYLLDRPELVPIQVSRRATFAEIEQLKRKVSEQLDNGAVAVSPFISPGEKEIAEMVMERDYGSLILIKPVGFPPVYKPSGAYFELCAQGRLLVLTAFPPTGRKATLTRECCLQMNSWVQSVCIPPNQL